MKHGALYSEADWATPAGPQPFPLWASLEFRVALRTNYLHLHLDPDDNIAFQELCNAFLKPEPGRPMDPNGVVVCVLGHAIKWPPCVRYFGHYLLNVVRGKGRNPEPEEIVGAFYATVMWAHQKPFTEMHAILSVAPRSHAVSGLAISAQQLGVIFCDLDAECQGCQPECREIELGPAVNKYFLKQTS